MRKPSPAESNTEKINTPRVLLTLYRLLLERELFTEQIWVRV